MPEQFTIGIDLGTSSVKALVVELAGQVAGRGQAAYPTSRRAPDRAEQRPADWWSATVAATHEALTSASIAPERVAAVGLSGQMHGTVVLGADGEPIGDAIIWMDRRAADEVARLEAVPVMARVVAITGNRPATGYMAATVAWLRRSEPVRFERAAAFLTPKDWLRFRLTGELATEPSDASGTLLFDVGRRAWSAEMADLAGVPLDRLPPVIGSGEIAGRLTRDAASDLGLPPGLPVVAGSADAPAAALGAGVTGERQAMLTLSTGSQQYVPSRTPAIDPTGKVHTLCAPLDPAGPAPAWYRMTATLNLGSALRWFADRMGSRHVTDDNDPFALAAQSPPGANGALFLPYLDGERSPLFDPDARGAFLGLASSHGQSDLARAVVEGVTLATVDAFADLRAAGADPDEIVVTGGGARSRWWLGMIADMYAIPTRAAREPDQSARGAALLAAAAHMVGDPGELAPRWADLGEPIAPDTDTVERYRELLVRFRAYRDALRRVTSDE